MICYVYAAYGTSTKYISVQYKLSIFVLCSCECNNMCRPAGLCKDTEVGPICQCDCQGLEECVSDSITLREECRCPTCSYNKPGERGCPSSK